jgi:hypothetical protein
MMLGLEILGGRAHLSLRDLVGGQFWENKPSLGFHGATSPTGWMLRVHMSNHRDEILKA